MELPAKPGRLLRRRIMAMLRAVALACLGVVVVCVARSARGDKPAEKFQMSKDEQKLLELTNKEREKKKLPALKPNPQLFKAARGHAANMAKQEKMEHVLDGKGPVQRARAAGYRDDWIGENIAASEEWMPKEIVADWMGSKGHRENILSKKYTEVGVGIAKTDKGEWYYTLLFGRPEE